MGRQGDSGEANEGVMRTQVCRGSHEYKCCCCHHYFKSPAAGDQDPDTSSSSSTTTNTFATFIICLFSFLVSIAGGFMLTWWEIKYHPTNTQFWMVPFGLVFFCTPIFIWFTTILSDFLCPISSTTAAATPPNHHQVLINDHLVHGACNLSRSDYDSIRDLETGS